MHHFKPSLNDSTIPTLFVAATILPRFLSFAAVPRLSFPTRTFLLLISLFFFFFWFISGVHTFVV
jgi:hypothetical protein